MRIKLIVFVMLIFGFSCSDDDILNQIIVTTKDNVVILSNGGEKDVYYFLVERGAAVAILWGPSVTNDSIKLIQGESILIPFHDIIGYDAGDNELILYYWNAVKSRGELVPGEVNNTMVVL